MASSTTFKRNKSRQRRQSLPLDLLHRIPLLPRRLGAWVVEISMVTSSAFLPYQLGVYVQSQSQADLVPLSPVLAQVEDSINQILALPRQPASQRRVPPLTNLFWWGALLSPVVVGGWQIYLLGTTGQTSPKRWFGIKIITLEGETPGVLGAGLREGIGRWGIPVGLAYLIWLYTGAFPDLVILLGLSGVMLILEKGMLFWNEQQRSLQDFLAGTLAVNETKPYSTYAYSEGNWGQPITVEVAPNRHGTGDHQTAENAGVNNVKTIVLTTVQPPRPPRNLWHWMHRNPGTTLLLITLAGITAVLGTFVGTQIYIQGQANRREFKHQDNEVFLALVKQLSATSSNPVEERRAAILALARLDDSRAAPLLVDLLGQETNPMVVETLQQAIVSTGLRTLEPLQRLNQSLQNDLNQNSSPAQKQIISLRLQTTQRAVAKLLNLYGGYLHQTNLRQIDLSALSPHHAPFSLIVNHTNLSGLNLRSAVLSHGSFRYSQFHSAGKDRRLGTFDDSIADLSGAELTAADFTGAVLSHVSLNRSNLNRANLKGANLSHAHLVSANLSSATLVGAKVNQALLPNASLSGANLVEANFSRANLQKARLGQVNATGADFSFGNLRQSDWQGSNLADINFSHSNLHHANLSSTELTGANLRHANLQEVDFTNTNLSYADLRGAKVEGANFQGVTLASTPIPQRGQFLAASPIIESFANLVGVDFTQVKNLSDSQIDVICYQGGIHPQCSQ